MDNQIASVPAEGVSVAFSPTRLRPTLLGLLTILLLPFPSIRAAESNVVASGETNLPLLTVRQFLEGAPAWGEEKRVRVQGTVTHSISDKTFFIQSGDAGTYVFHKPATALHVGEFVEVTGYPSLTTVPTLQRCSIRLLGPGPLPSPQVARPADARAGQYHMQLVRVQGVLNPERLRGGHILVLNPGNGEKAFTADLEALSDLSPFEHLRPGSLLEVTGVCTVSRGPDKQPVSFNVFVRTPADISVLRLPSWWTPARTWRVLALVTFGLVLALAWVLTLRLQVRRQTAHIRQLNEQLEQRVRDRTAELTEANKELEAFTYSVSHDLRAPLRHISGFANIVAQQPAAQDPDVQRPLKQVADAATRLGRLMDDLLAFSRMARRPLARRPVPLGPLVSGIVQQLQQESSGRTIEWNIAALPEVLGDPSTLQIVWQNLLHNAVKYTRNRPKAVIEVRCEAGDHDWRFALRDNGAGFDARYVDRLFGIFQRLHHDSEFEGNGIGLANVRRIVHRHGGRIWAEGEIDRGATFHFTLPQSVKRPREVP
jgi:signal transduction histidine kinase